MEPLVGSEHGVLRWVVEARWDVGCLPCAKYELDSAEFRCARVVDGAAGVGVCCCVAQVGETPVVVGASGGL